MQSFTQRSLVRALAAAVILSFTFGAGAADAKSKIRQARDVRLLAFDTEAGTMTVKEKGKKVVYNVIFEGSVLKRTTATIDAKPVKLTDIPLKTPINIYWLPDEKDKKKRFARKVDALKIPEELRDDR
ncbi:MAG: hypothetical protein JRE71_08015 [Deltaproteobacteria bacterium]|nr:hypothetical protein [Deltaproteobacteria bacterium]